MTSLHWASRHGYVDIVRLLLDRGANADATANVSDQGACPHCRRTASPLLAAARLPAPGHDLISH